LGAILNPNPVDWVIHVHVELVEGAGVEVQHLHFVYELVGDLTMVKEITATVEHPIIECVLEASVSPFNFKAVDFSSGVDDTEVGYLFVVGPCCLVRFDRDGSVRDTVVFFISDVSSGDFELVLGTCSEWNPLSFRGVVCRVE